jgi:hypothetical protein
MTEIILILTCLIAFALAALFQQVQKHGDEINRLKK